MVHINLNEIGDTSESQLLQHLKNSGPRLRLTMTVPNQYRAGSKAELAANWLKTWYIAEILATFAVDCKCDFEESQDGEGEIELHFTVNDVQGMAEKLIQFAAIFDPDDLEATAMLYDEATDWLERDNKVVRFPDLEDSYRIDQRDALNHEDK